MISPAPYQVRPAVGHPVEDHLAVRLGVAHLVVGGHDLGAVRAIAISVRVHAQGDEPARGALAVRQRHEVAAGLGRTCVA